MRLDLGGRWACTPPCTGGCGGVDHLLAGEPQRRLLAGMTVHHARFLVAVQVQPAAHVVGLDEVLRHGGFADQRFHAADHALAGDARLEQDLVQVELELLGPVLRGVMWMPIALEKSWMPNTTCFTVEYCHDLRGDLERLGMLDDGLDGDARVEPRPARREIADLGGAVGLARPSPASPRRSGRRGRAPSRGPSRTPRCGTG